MANIANIVVFDGAATPVQHTLVPVSILREPSGRIVATWREQIASLPTYAQVTAKLTLSRTAKSGVWNADFRTEVPVMEAIAGVNASGYTAAPKVAYIDTSGFYGHYHERGSIAGRRISRQLTVNAAGGIATSVAAVSTGVVPELIDQLIAPT